MTSFKSEFRRAFIAGASQRDTSADLAAGSFDVAIYTSSWDARSISITDAKHLKSTLGICILFNTRDKAGLRDKHDAALNKFSTTTSVRTVTVTGESCQVNIIWKQIYDFLIQTRIEQRRPLRIFLDMSACPRYYSLGVTAAAFVKNLASTLTLFYAEASYSEDTERGDFAFTGGHWSTVTVPFLSGLISPGKKTFYLVSAGFEGEKTFRAVSRADPDRVSLVIAKPGYCPAYERRAMESNEHLIQEFVIPKNEIICAPASDAIATWRILDQSALHRERQENSFYMCCGTKPHALALALNAISLGYPAVLYNIPEEHRVHRTAPNGVFWTYTLQNITAIE
jgi:hypothetical protein